MTVRLSRTASIPRGKGPSALALTQFGRIELADVRALAAAAVGAPALGAGEHVASRSMSVRCGNDCAPGCAGKGVSEGARARAVVVSLALSAVSTDEEISIGPVRIWNRYALPVIIGKQHGSQSDRRTCGDSGVIPEGPHTFGRPRDVPVAGALHRVIHRGAPPASLPCQGGLVGRGCG